MKTIDTPTTTTQRPITTTTTTTKPTKLPTPPVGRTHLTTPKPAPVSGCALPLDPVQESEATVGYRFGETYFLIFTFKLSNSSILIFLAHALFCHIFNDKFLVLIMILGLYIQTKFDQFVIEICL